jgi:histidyl-tRNA synthetase
MARIEPRVLRGFRDYLPREMLPRVRMLAAIERGFQRFGFAPLQTPAIEYLDVLMGKYGDEGSKLLYRFRDEGDREVALRYDLTVPLARVVAQYPDLPRPFRRYQIAPVWRAERPARGRFREFVQCDADIVGAPEPIADAEIIGVGCGLLDDLGVARYRIRVNHRKVLAGMEAACGIAPEAAQGVLRTVDKLPKIGPDETRRLLQEENGLAREQADRLFEFLAVSGTPAEVLGRLDALFPGPGPGREGAEALRKILGLLEAVGLGGRIAIDLSIARGLDYYTGTVYETFLEDLPGFGAVMSGGRYDGLIGTFSSEEIPAVGISLGIDRLTAGLVELKLLGEGRSSVADVLVTVFDEAHEAHAVRAAAAVRAAGIDCELYPSTAKLGKQFKHAERQGARWVVVVGPDEAARGEVRVKDMASGEQEAVPLAKLGDHLQSKRGKEA